MARLLSASLLMQDSVAGVSSDLKIIFITGDVIVWRFPTVYKNWASQNW